jgi:1-pyrroline dehydrogenase
MVHVTSGPPTLLSSAYVKVEQTPVAHFIDNEFAPQDGKTHEVVNPADGHVIVTAPLGTSKEVDIAVASARRAFRTWRRTTPAVRAERLLALADEIERHSELLAQIESLNTGKPLMVSREEPAAAVDSLRFFAGAVRTPFAPAPGEYAADNMSMIVREPVGVVGAIAPWNYPLMMAIWKVAPALAAGNTVVLKPSELTPLSTVVLAQLVRDILPPGVVNIVLGSGPTVGQSLAQHSEIAMVSLTGSVASGVSVASNAAQGLKRLHLELGGKAPVIVHDDADLDQVVDTLRLMGFWNSGQECGAATRVLCHHSSATALEQRLADAASSLRVGDPAQSEDIEMGPLISQAHLARVESKVKYAIDDGARLVTGGHTRDLHGYFFEPTVLTNVDAGAPITRDEIFGPVVTIERFSLDEEAIAAANDVPFGLAASVWTADLQRALRACDDLEFGTVWVNNHLTLASEMPWSGFGMSGYGRDMSSLALDDYTRTKHVMIAKGART